MGSLSFLTSGTHCTITTRVFEHRILDSTSAAAAFICYAIKVVPSPLPHHCGPMLLVLTILTQVRLSKSIDYRDLGGIGAQRIKLFLLGAEI